MSGSWAKRAWVTGWRCRGRRRSRRPRLSTPASSPRRTRRSSGRRCRPARGRRRRRRSRRRRPRPRRRGVRSPSRAAGDLDPAARGDADGAGGGQQRRWRRRWPGCPTGPTHTSTGTSAVLDALDQLVEAVVGDHRARAVELEDEGDGPVVLGLVDLGLDEVDQHPVEQAADLDHGDVAGVVGLPGGARPAGRASEQRRGARAPRQPWLASSGPPAVASAGSARSGRLSVDPARFFAASRLVIVAGKGGVGKTMVTRHPGPRGRAGRAVDPGRRGRGQVGPGLDVRPGRARLRRGGALAPAGARRARARCGPARSRPTRRSSSTSRTTGCPGSRKRLVSSGALDVVATAAPGHQGHPHPRQGEAARAGGEADLIVLDAPAAGHAITFLQAARAPARRRAGRPDQRPGPRRARDAHRPRALPGGARDAARGDAGQRAGRHRVQPRGPGRRQPRAGRRQRPLRRRSPGSTPTRSRRPRRPAPRCAPGEAEALAAAAAFRRRPHRAPGRAGRPPGRPAAAAAAPPAVPVHRRARARRARRCSPTASSPRSTRSRRPCDAAPDAARARRAAPHPRVLRLRRRRQDDHRRGRSRSRRRGPGRRAVVVTIDPAKRLADALGLEGLTDTPSADRRATGPASCGR